VTRLDRGPQRADSARRGGECPQEELVVRAVLTRAWPNGCDEALVAHAAECHLCGEVAGLASVMREDSEDSRGEIQVPAAGQVWWRAAVRARLESTHAATRPITWMHGITAALVLGVLLGAITMAWTYVPGAAEDFWRVAREFFPNTEVASAVGWGLRQSVLLGLVAVGFLVIAPLAVYLVISGD
jgi:hypothetical protein